MNPLLKTALPSGQSSFWEEKAMVKKKSIYKPKIINGLLIEEKNIKVVDEYYLYNIPLKISCEGKEFYLPRKSNLIDGKEFTWWCQNARKIDKQNEENT